MPIEQDLLRWMEARRGRFAYGNSWAGKFTPDTSGYTDCSGVLRTAYLDCYGIDIGKMSYDIARNGREIASGTTPAGLADALATKARTGDIIAYAMRSGLHNGTAINHVDMVATGGLAWDHGGPGTGPRLLNPVTNRWLGPDAARWTIRRFIQPDKPTEKKKDMNAKQSAKLDQIHTWLKTLDLSESKIDQVWQRRGKIDQIPTMQGQIDALTVAVKQIAKGDIDMDAILDAAREGARQGATAVAAQDIADELELRVKGDS